MNQKDERIAKMWHNGNHTLESLARKLGMPGNLARVKDGLSRKGIVYMDEIA